MSMAKVRENLGLLLADDDNRVVALTGAWGTGKTHMWREMSKAAPAGSQLRRAYYASLFGVKDITQLKARIIQSALPEKMVGQDIAKAITTGWKQAVDIAKKVHPAFTALDEVTMLAVPSLLRGRLIVIDDIERKNSALHLDEVLGFIDEYKELHQSRFLLMLNSGNLTTDSELWKTFREKIIDHEVVLKTTPEEAFDIAEYGVKTPYSILVRQAVSICELSNIRIVKRVIRVVDRVLAGRIGLSPEVLERVVPPTVLLTALHLKGLPDSPDEEFVLSFNSVAQIISHNRTPKGGSQDEQEMRETHKRWSDFLSKLGLQVSGEFDRALSVWLKTGLFDATELREYLDTIIAKQDSLEMQRRCWDFIDRVLFEPDVPDEDLVAEVKVLIRDISKVDGSMATALGFRARSLPGGEDIEKSLITAWVEAFEREKSERPRHFDVVERAGELHPLIHAAYVAQRERTVPKRSLAEQVLWMIGKGGWTPQDEARLSAATSEEYHTTIRALHGADLKAFLYQSVEWLKHRGMSERQFGGTSQAFLDACKAIVADDDRPRRQATIRTLFKAENLSDLLEPPLAAADESGG